MTEALREQIRQHAHFAGEFCGVSETDSGGELTIDHFQPKACGGSDSLENLLYCCARCNQYKMDFWPTSPEHLPLWNPRVEPFASHFLELDDGALHPLTPIGAFTMKRLRLNRPPLVAYRLRRKKTTETLLLLQRYRDLAQLLAQSHQQTVLLLEEQQKLLAAQRELLRLLIK
jgi:hypothetical protein